MKKIIILLFAIMMAIPVLPVQATSASDLTINGEGSQTESTYGGSGSSGNYTNLNSNDDAVSYLHNNVSSYMYHCYDMTNFSASVASINSVTMTYRISCTTYGTQFTPYVRDLSTGQNYYGTTTAGSISWTTVTYTWNLNPVTSAAWTTATINAYEWGFRTWGDSGIGQGVYTSYMKLTVSYEPMTAPVVTTQAVSAIAETTATGNGNVTSDGGSAVTERGTVISTSANPTTGDHKDTAAGTTGAYTTSITALTKNTTYHVRAYAINAIGTSYGADVSFITLGDPTISTVAASNIALSTAQMNSNVTFDGSTACTVTFIYKAGTGYANYAAISAAAGTEIAATGTYTTGQLPYTDLSGLASLTAYSFAVKIVNPVSTAYGSVLTFTTLNAVTAPATLTAIPSATKISLSWPIGSGSTYTLVRYSSALYPATNVSGTLGYLGAGNSVQISSLTPGTTYYISAWGLSGTTYSSTYTTVLSTTLAYDTISSNTTIEVPVSNSMWTQTPNTTKVSNLPGAFLISDWATAYEVPLNMAWYFVWMLIGIGGGIILYNRSSYNLPMTLAAELIWFGIGAAIGLIMLWIIVVLLVIGMGFTVFGNRH